MDVVENFLDNSQVLSPIVEQVDAVIEVDVSEDMLLPLDDVDELELDLLSLGKKILGFGDAYLIIQKENIAQ